MQPSNMDKTETKISQSANPSKYLLFTKFLVSLIGLTMTAFSKWSPI